MFCEVKDNVSEPTKAEAFGAWKIVKVVTQLDLGNIILEGDSLIIVQALTKEDDYWSLYGQVVNDARAKLKSFYEWEVNYVSRVARSCSPLS